MSSLLFLQLDLMEVFVLLRFLLSGGSSLVTLTHTLGSMIALHVPLESEACPAGGLPSLCLSFSHFGVLIFLDDSGRQP